MSRIVLYAAAVFVLLHGLVHLIGFVAYWPLSEVKDLPYKTTLLNGKCDIGRIGMRLFSLLWLVTAITFAVSAYALVMQHYWWLPVMLGTSLFSLLMTVLDWAPAFRGAIINIVILVTLVISRLWPF